jgi:hypothetical protein
MNTNPTPEAPDTSPDPNPQLQREIYLQLVHELVSMLPPPVDTGPDKRAALDRRIKTATALVSGMLPATAEEADLAVHAVAAGAHASDCLRQAVRSAGDPAIALKLRAQAASMGREARGYRGLLLRLQAVREKREADDKAREAAAWTEHCVAGLMTQGFEAVPLDQTVEADTAARDARLEAEVDRYAIAHPRRTQLIRRFRGVPEKCEFGLPAKELVAAIVSGDSPHLRAADWLPTLGV